MDRRQSPKFRLTAEPPKDAVPITKQMIDVGALILVEYGGIGPYVAEHLAEDVYRAMVGIAVTTPKQPS